MCSDFSSVLSRVRNPNSSEDPSSNCATFPSLSTIITTTTTTTNVVGAAAGLDEDDWPTTPTSSEQKIPEIGPCPPAPRRPKSKPIVRKRKHYSTSSSSSEFGGGIIVHNTNNYCCNNNSSASRLLDFSKEIELMYPPHLKANLGRKIKKARSL